MSRRRTRRGGLGEGATMNRLGWDRRWVDGVTGLRNIKEVMGKREEEVREPAKHPTGPVQNPPGETE